MILSMVGERMYRATRFHPPTQQITVSDEKGSLQWTEKDGLRFLRATDLEGHVLFEGAITTDEDREKIPDGVAERLQAMQEKGQIPVD